MPTICPPNRNPHAAVVARIRGLRRPFVSRLIVFILVAGIACPVLFVEPRSVEADARTSVAAPVSSPPEAFIVHKAETRAVASVLPAAIETISSSFASPTLPAGFGSAKVPTATERFASFVRPVLGLVASTKSAIPNPNSKIAMPPPTGTVLFDFDEDGKADIGRWHSSSTEFEVRNSSTGNPTTHEIGSSSSIPAPGDFDGDGMTDAAVFNAGAWVIKKSSNGSTQNISFGTSGDVPVAADYDGDGITDAAVFRPSTNVWWVLKSSDSSYTQTSHGASGDIPVTGNWDGDSYADLAVFRPSNGNWYVQRSTSGSLQVAWGLSTDVPVPADFDGDDKTDVAVYRPATGAWWVMKSSTGFDGSYVAYNWGNYGDQPVPADYDGDGNADFAVWRPKTGVWYISKSSEDNEEYEYHGLGVAGDRAVPSAYIKQVATTVYGDDMALARLSAKNATGGTSLYSRNFSWGTQLVGLPGRSGLDAGFGIGYNSLVWTKLGSDIHFDVDQGNVSPGFRLGFPTIEAPYYDDGDKDAWAFMMVAPSGSRIEFRQTAVSGVYETADSSYTQLKLGTGQSVSTPIEDIDIEVRTTDGTLMTYEWLGGAYRCSQIRDRNGNYITIEHDEYGTLEKVTDTLGREIVVHYDSLLYPTSITQTWKGTNGSGSDTTHTWATFAYTTKTVATNFGSLNVIGPPNDTVIKVLQKITYADQSYTKFTHNGYIQVEKIENYAADDHLLNRVTTDLDSISTSQSDCPRFTETRSYAENFNGGEDVIVHNDPPVSDGYSVGGLTGDAAKVVVHMGEDHPDELYSQIYFGESGWKEGLPLATEDCTGDPESDCSTRKRWTWTGWTQDNSHPTDPSTLSYILNPRVVESRVGDGTNTKKSTVEYWVDEGTNIAIYGLVKSAFVYDTDLSTILKKTYSTYNLASEYTSRRIIGLPSLTEYYGRESSGLNLMSKVTYSYDEGNFSDSGLQQNISPTRHDGTNFGSSFIAGRGNLTSTTRWNVDYPTNSSYAITSSVKYNTAGSVVSQTDPRGRISKIFYADDWNSSGNPSTYAYPTTVTDPGGFSSNIEYRYDLGANVWAKSPTPSGSGNSNGKTTSRTYSDTTGRIVKEKIENSGAYTRYDYPNTGIAVNTYTTIVDITGPGTIDGSDEVLTETLLDGAGRVRRTRTENPGSTGGYSGKLVEYDILGRVERETVPTDIDSSWNPAGDDYRGMDGSSYIWLWNTREYDWMDRVTREINTDGSDRLFTYAGCGCAGGLVTTIEGEETDAVDAGGTMQADKRRTRKIYQDILGRAFKTELWDLDGAGSDPYSTLVNSYNGRDQVIVSRQHAGAASSSTYQDTTMTYDGHGRISTRHLPVESASTATSWTYNPDNTVATVTDPRGAVMTYKYGNIDDSGSTEYRPLLTKIAYTSPNTTTIPDPTDVEFSYDAAGNRTAMTDASGGMTYSYDELSRLMVETKTFTDTLNNAPEGGYQLEYTYHLTGGLKSLEDDFAARTVTYSTDKLGRLTAVDGSGFGQSALVSSIAYRAFGVIKSMKYETEDDTDISLSYDSRLRPSAYQAESAANTVDIQNKTYSYNPDGMINEAINTLDGDYSQYYDYDFAGRLKRNEFGTISVGEDKPYKQTLGYDAFSNITSRSTWARSSTAVSFTAEYTNHRKTSGGFGGDSFDTHDAAGNVVYNNASSTPPDWRSWKFDAAGRMTDWLETTTYGGVTRWDQGETLTFDGDGRTVKRVKRSRQYASPPSGWVEEAEYCLYSSVTGQKISELNSAGSVTKTNVYLGSSVIAEKRNSELVFKHPDPVTGSEMQTEDTGEITPFDVGRIEREAMGAVVPTSEPEAQGPPHDFGRGGSTSNPEGECEMDSVPIHCNQLSVPLRGLPLGGVFAQRRKKQRIVLFHSEDPFGQILVNFGEPHVIFDFGDKGLGGEWTVFAIGSPSYEDTVSFFDKSLFADLFESTGNFKGVHKLALKGAAAGQTLLERVLTGTCGQKVQELLDAIGKIKNLSAASVLDLYRQITTAQQYGGVQFNSVDVGSSEFKNMTGRTAPGAGGLAFRTHRMQTYNIGGNSVTGIEEAFIWIRGSTITRGLYRSPIADQEFVQVQITAAALKTFDMLIHELFHVAAKSGMFSHLDLDAAAESLDKDLRPIGYAPRLDDARLFDRYIQKYCPGRR